MPVGATLAVAGAGLASGAMSSSAARSAARTQQQGTDAAVAEQRRQFDEMVRLSRPGLDRANSAAETYMRALGLGGPQQPQTQPRQQNYQGQPGGINGGGYSGSGPVGGFGQGGASDMAVQMAPRLMTGGKGGEPQLMPGGEDFSGPQVYTGGAVPGDPQVLPGQPGQPGEAGGNQGALDIAELVRNTPGYQAQLDQGIRSIDRAAPLVGGMYSGRRMKALEGHGQQTFGSYYDNWMNRVGGMAGQAPQIAQNVGQAGMQNANNIGGLMVQGANARAQGAVNSASAWGGALGDVVGAGMMLGGQAGWFRK
jgi:hypothetical protein